MSKTPRPPDSDWANSPGTSASITWLRWTALTEGVSFLLLLGLAMPLKYLGGWPEPVSWVGWAHGVLFMLLCLLLAVVWHRHRWSLTMVAAVFVAALLPGGPFVLDRRLRALQPAGPGVNETAPAEPEPAA